VTGWPVMTVARGRVVAENGRVVGDKGFGRVLEREISPYAARPEAA
jgi:dihydropyrimidinase